MVFGERCKCFSIENKQCGLLYHNPLCLDLNDLKMYCDGVNVNKLTCPYYSRPFSDEEIKKLREALRKNNKETL